MDIRTRYFVFWIISAIKSCKVFILLTSLIVSTLVMYMTSKQPKIYSAKTSIIYDSSTGGLTGLVKRVGLANLGQTKGISGMLIREILLSYSMHKDIIEHFNLVKRLNQANEYRTYLRLRKLVKITNYTLKSIIVIQVKFPDAQIASDIANFYIKNLLKMNKRIKLSTEKDLVKVLDQAEKPVFPIGPNTYINTIASFFGTLLVTIILSLIWGALSIQMQEWNQINQNS